jgi:hypothetical protein
MKVECPVAASLLMSLVLEVLAVLQYLCEVKTRKRLADFLNSGCVKYAANVLNVEQFVRCLQFTGNFLKTIQFIHLSESD